MNFKNKLKSYSPVIILSVLLIISTLLCFNIVYAKKGFSNIKWNWNNINDELDADVDSTYPFDVPSTDSSQPEITSIGLDVLYGKTRNLVTFNAGLPEANTTNDDGELIDTYDSCIVEGTSLSSDGTPNPGKDGNNTVSAKDYWGFDTSNTDICAFDTEGKVTLSDLQNVNSEEIVSLRLYALSHCKNKWFGNIGYWFVKLLATVAYFIIDLIVKAKNIDMKAILEILRLDDLANNFTETFIGNADEGRISAFMAFAIIMFIFALVMYVIRYVRASNKTESLSNIIVTSLCGVLVIGMCLSGRISTLGSSLSDVTEKLMYAVAGSLSSSTETDIFVTDIVDEKRQNQVTQMQEMSLINKSFIELQLCTQFAVDDIADLDVSKFGDDGGTLASTYLKCGENFEDNFDNNLGYYFWFANSSAKEKTVGNKTLPETNTVVAEQKLDSMITYLQVCYNNANSTEKTRITNIILGLANNNVGSGIISLLLFTIILAVLAICLLKYALNVMFAKLGMFFALIGMTLAGPFLITGNKKLIETGKTILGLMVVSLIHITVYSIFFDLILFIISAVISPKFMDLLLAVFLVGLLFYFNPMIQSTLKRMLERAEQSVCKDYSRNARAVKQWARQKASGAIDAYDRKSKIVGYNENGDAIYEANKGNRLSKMLHQAQNNVFNEGAQRQGIFKINSEMNNARNSNVANSRSAKRKAAEALVAKTQAKIAQDSLSYQKNLEFEEQQKIRDTYSSSETGINFNESMLTAEELARKQEIDKLKAEQKGSVFSKEAQQFELNKEHNSLEEQIKIAESRKEIVDRQEGEEFDAAKKRAANELISLKMKMAANQQKINDIAKEREAFEQQQAERENNINSKSASLVSDINERINRETLENHDLGQYSSFEEAADHKAQEDHKDELKKALDNQIAEASVDANTKVQDKIGGKKTVNKEAMSSLAAAQYQSKQLEEGYLVSGKAEAESITKDIVDAVARKKGSSTQKNPEIQAGYAKHDVATTRNSHKERAEAHKDARQSVKDAKQKDRENKATGKSYVKEAKHDNGRVISSTNISEDITAALKHLEAQSRQIDNEKASLDKARREENKATAGRGDAKAYKGHQDTNTNRGGNPTSARREDYN